MMYGLPIFTPTELRDITIAWLALSACFTLVLIRNHWPIWMAIAASMLVLGVHFVFHELAHKFTAQAFGYWAEFKMWTTGILLALVLAFATFGLFIFAAPGAVYIASPYAPWGYPNERLREGGIIAASGPMVNLAFAFAFLMATPIIGGIGKVGFYIGTVLAAFNLLPFPPLDGYKVMRWSLPVWLALAALAWWLVLMP